MSITFADRVVRRSSTVRLCKTVLVLIAVLIPKKIGAFSDRGVYDVLEKLTL